MTVALRVIDSHSEGEPTRVVIDGWPALRGRTMRERRDEMRERHDHLRRAVVAEPRGHAALVGALLTAPVSEGAEAGIVFFNAATYLGMCGHGLMGVVRTLEHLGRLRPGRVLFDTPAGRVSAELGTDGAVTIENVPSRLHARDVSVDVPGVGHLTGDVAYGGNWFFLAHEPVIASASADIGELTRITFAIRDALLEAGMTGEDGAGIDHIELSGPPSRSDADARNFVLCSSGDFDRSPCGTGTSAVMAARYSRGLLALGERWRQESISGSLFTGWLSGGPAGEIVPHLRGNAFVTAESTLRMDPDDPFRFGLPAR